MLKTSNPKAGTIKPEFFKASGSTYQMSKERLQELYGISEEAARELYKHTGEKDSDLELATKASRVVAENEISELEPQQRRLILESRIALYLDEKVDEGEFASILREVPEEDLIEDNNLPLEVFMHQWDYYLATRRQEKEEDKLYQQTKKRFNKRWVAVGLHANALTKKGATAYRHSRRAYMAVQNMGREQLDVLLDIKDDQSFYNVVRQIMKLVKEAGEKRVMDSMIYWSMEKFQWS